MSATFSFEALCRRIAGIEPRELEHWIALRWVKPDSADEGWVFREVDLARVQLILELRRDLEIDEAAIPVVLGLLDQLYDMRRRMKALAAALESLPEESRAAVKARLDDPRED